MSLPCCWQTPKQIGYPAKTDWCFGPGPRALNACEFVQVGGLARMQQAITLDSLGRNQEAKVTLPHAPFVVIRCPRGEDCPIQRGPPWCVCCRPCTPASGATRLPTSPSKSGDSWAASRSVGHDTASISSATLAG